MKALVLALLALVLSVVPAAALPAIPEGSVVVDQQVLGVCDNGKIMLRYVYQAPDGAYWATIKTPNGPVVAVMKFNSKGEPTVYVGDRVLSQREAQAQYGDGCSLLKQKRT